MMSSHDSCRSRVRLIKDIQLLWLVPRDCTPKARAVFFSMIYSERQLKIADATIKKLLANESAMVKNEMLAFVDELSEDDRMLANDVVSMLEEDGLITYTGNYDWRVQLTSQGCKAAKMGLDKYLKHLELTDKLKEYKLYINIVCTAITIVSMFVTIILTILNAARLMP